MTCQEATREKRCPRTWAHTSELRPCVWESTSHSLVRACAFRWHSHCQALSLGWVISCSLTLGVFLCKTRG